MTETKNDPFLNQVEDLQSVESYGGQADYLYFRHENPKEGSLPVLVAGGWSEGTQSLRDTAQVIFDEGREVILLDHARDGGIKDSKSGNHPEEEQKSQTILNVLDDSGIQKVDVIAHSEGSLNIILAAKAHPEKFRNMVLVAPAGMLGKDTIPRLTVRFIHKIARGMTTDMKEIKARDPESAKRFAAAGPSYIRANPLKALREVEAIAHSQINNDLEELRKAGIKISVLQSHSDEGFPDRRIYEQTVLREADKIGSEYVDLDSAVDSYASVAAFDAGHDDLIIHPQRTTRAALDMLAGLEKLGQ